MPKTLRELWQLLGAYQRWYVLAGSLSVFAILMRSFEPRILQLVVDYVLVLPFQEKASNPPPDDWVSQLLLWPLPAPDAQKVGQLLLGLGLLYLLLSLLRAAGRFGAEAIKNWSTDQVAKRQRDDIFAHIQRLPLAYFTTTTRGELIQRLTGDVDTVKNFLRGQVFQFVSILATFGFAFWMMAMVDLTYALISVALAPFIILTAFFFFKEEKKIWRLHEKESDQLNTLVQENLNGIRTVVAYANETHEIGRFQRQNEAKLRMGFRHNRLHAWFWPSSDMLTNLQLLLSILTGGYFVVQGRITVGELLSFYTYISMVAWPIRSLGRILSEMGMASVALSRLSEVHLAEAEGQRGEVQPSLRGAIEFRQVSFRYKPEDEPALQDVSFHIRPGEKVAIIGPTGSGKSTLIKLLLRLYDPQSGEIWLDGQPLTQYSRLQLRRQIGLALQQPFLFSTTIHGNIAYTQPQAQTEQVHAAAKVAQAYDLQRIMPQGFQTRVGEKGVTLSGGQKQRVALARTLLPRPGLLVLDDITSAVDTETEHAIFAGLETWLAEKTTLIISHRVTSIQQADRVLVLEHGRLVAEGSPEELALQPGYYQEIHRIQANSDH